MVFVDLPKAFWVKVSFDSMIRMILTSQFVEDQVLKFVNKFDVLLSMTRFWILTIDCERVDQCVRSNNTKEIHFSVFVLKSC